MLYGYLCEDVVQEVFIDAVLNALKTDKEIKCKEFKKSEDFYNKIRVPSSNKTHVTRNYDKAIKLGFSEYKLNLFIAAIDYDEAPLDNFNKYKKQLEDKVDHKLRKKFIAAIPVKCIEYWLLYTLEKEINTNSECYEEDSVFKNKDAKKKVYTINFNGEKREITRALDQANRAKEILENLDINYLKSKSKSFSAFYDDIKKFCSIYG